MKTNQLFRVSLIGFMVLFCSTLFGETSFEIKGKVSKSETPSMNQATVTLLDANTREIVANEITNEKGEFVIKDVKKGNYILVVQKLGYRKTEERQIKINEKGIVVEERTQDLI